MYNVSDKYKEKIKSLSRETKIKGTLSLSNGTEIDISDSAILKGSLNIDNSCVNKNDFELGSVYVGMLKCSIKNDTDRYSFYDGILNLSFLLKVGDDEWEEVPLGIYHINEANRKGKYVSIESYDNMIKLDAPLNTTTIGSPYELLLFISSSTGVELEQTEEEINALSPIDKNGVPISVKIPIENSYENYRDLLSDIAILLGGFATISRSGKILIRRFCTDEISISNSQIKSKTISDYEVYYSQVSSVIDGKKYVSGDDTGSILEIDNELFSTGTDAIKQIIIDNIASAIADSKYTPVNIKINSDPSVDLGDYIEYTNIDKVNTVKSLIMKNTFVYKSSQTIVSVGSNPRLSSSKSRTDKQLSNVQNTVNSGGLKILSFQSSKIYKIGSSQTLISETEINVGGDCSAMFSGQVILNVTVPGTFKIIYQRDSDIFRFSPMQTISNEGSYIINLYSIIDGLKSNSPVLFSVYLLSEDGGVAEIDKNNVWTSILSTSIVPKEEKPFDGNVKEDIGAFAFGVCQLSPFTDSFTHTVISPVTQNISESISKFTFGGIQVCGFIDNVTNEIIQK